MLDLAAIRAALPATGRYAYLNAGTWGPLTRAAAEAMQGRIERALEDGRITQAGFDEFLGAYDSAREAFARALGSSPERVALTHSATGAVNLALGGLELGRGDEVVSSDAEHPGLDEPLATLERRRGVVVRRAALRGGGDPVEALLELVTPRTRLIATSHVLWGTGRVLPVAQLAQAARSRGVLTLIDGAQSAGALDVGADELGADLYAVPGQKWLLGPTGTGALHMREGLEDVLEVSQGGYFSRDRKDPQLPLWPGARRFDGATVSIVALLGLSASITWRDRELGWDEGYRRAREQCARCLELLDACPGVTIPDRGAPRATLVSFALEGWDPEQLSAALSERGVVGRWLPAPRAVRVSVGFWTSDEDLARLDSALRGLGRGPSG